jgi:hypothetical protein
MGKKIIRLIRSPAVNCSYITTQRILGSSSHGLPETTHAIPRHVEPGNDIAQLHQKFVNPGLVDDLILDEA